MAVVKPFPAIRPQAVKAAQIAALPYDVFTREEAVKEIEKHPLSFSSGGSSGNKFSGRDRYVQSPRYMKRQESFSGSWWIQEICVRIWSLVTTSMSSVWENMCRPA